MKKRLQGFIAGVLSGIAVAGTIGAFAYTDYIEAVYNNIKIVVDGKEIHPNSEPFISNGTTYLPVRAVSEALGKEVTWDGPNYTVYIGEMGGRLEYPTMLMSDMDNIGDNIYKVNTDMLTDNYGNTYSEAANIVNGKFETLLNNKFSRFKCTIYSRKGANVDNIAKITIKADGKVLYSSPELTKTSAPIKVDIDITGYNDFEIIQSVNGSSGSAYFGLGLIGDAGFYQ